MTQEKIGRNDPCHCGSGKKYKKCHLPLEKEEHLEVLEKQELERLQRKLEEEERFQKRLMEMQRLFAEFEDPSMDELDSFVDELTQLPLEELLARLEEYGATSPSEEIDALLKQRDHHWFSGVDHHDQLTGISSLEGFVDAELRIGFLMDEYVRRQHPDVMIYSDAQEKLDDLYEFYDMAEDDIVSAHALLLMWDHVLDTFGEEIPGSVDAADEWTRYFQYELSFLLEDTLTFVRDTPYSLENPDHTRIIERIARSFHQEPLATKLLALTRAQHS